MKRTAAIALAGLSLFAVPVYASDIRDTTDTTVTAPAAGNNTAATPIADSAATTPAAANRVMLPAEWVASRQRPKALPALYASLATLQIFDAYSTQRALAGGHAHEANPMMKGVVGSPAMLWSIKVAAAVAPMLAAERLWKTNKVAAVAVMAVSNGVMATVAMHNARVLKGQR